MLIAPSTLAAVVAPSTVSLLSRQSPPVSSTRTRSDHVRPRSVLLEKKIRELSSGAVLLYLSSSFQDSKIVPFVLVCERSKPSQPLSCCVGGESPISSPLSKLRPASVERWTTMRHKNSESCQFLPERCS